MIPKASNLASISERRSQYPLHERLIVYDTESMQRKMEIKTTSVPTTKPILPSFVVNGVNILNKNSLDSDTVMNRIVQRRQTHNRVERRRRDRMNTLFNNLSKCVPSIKHKDNNSRADVLQEAIDYIRQIQAENVQLKYGTGNLYPIEDDLASLSSTDSSMISSPSRTTSFNDNSNNLTMLALPQSHFESILSFH